MSFLERDAEKLIRLVEERPVLWDRSIETYRDRNLTRDAWREICLSFDEDFNERSTEDKAEFGRQVIKKWSNIRDAWLKVCKKEKENKKLGNNRTKKYVYDGQLQFLRSVVLDQREIDSNIDSLDGQLSPTRNDTNKEDSKLILNQLVEDSTKKEGDTNKDKKANSSKQENSEEVTNVGKKRKLDEFETRLLSAVETQKDDEPRLMFFKGILPTVNQFSNDEFLDFQMGVLQLLKNMSGHSKPSNPIGIYPRQNTFHPSHNQPHYSQQYPCYNHPFYDPSFPPTPYHCITPTMRLKHSRQIPSKSHKKKIATQERNNENSSSLPDNLVTDNCAEISSPQFDESTDVSEEEEFEF